MKPLFLFALGTLLGSMAFAQQPAPELQPLSPFVGKTWKGTFASSTPESPMVDVSRWEWALNGRAIRILHSLNDGEYGGESIIMWDESEESLVAYYFTTAGFSTRAIIEADASGYRSTEEVTGHQGGITSVESHAVLHPDGRLESVSRYLRNGTWEDGHSITYVESPGAEVRFRNPK
jgi:hypothetical protein